MTGAMVRAILELALTKLIELPPATLASYEQWLKRKHIRWCLDHVGDCAPWDEEHKTTHALLERVEISLKSLREDQNTEKENS